MVPERVGGFGLLDSGHDEVVDTEAGGHGEYCQREIGDDTDDGAECKRQKHDQTGAKHYARFLYIAPEQQLLHYSASASTTSISAYHGLNSTKEA